MTQKFRVSMATTRALETNHPNSQAIFEAFFEQWLIKQEHYLQELLPFIETNKEVNQLHMEELINQVMVHYKDYYKAKAKVMRGNAFLVISPPWFSSFERIFLWIGGFRVGLAFRLVSSNISNLTEDQSKRINTLKMEVKEEENELTDELLRVQDGLTVELARNLDKPVNGKMDKIESAFERLSDAMEALVECADFLRMKTTVNLMEILEPAQWVRFLAAVTHLQLRLHRFGTQRDTEFQRINANL